MPNFTRAQVEGFLTFVRQCAYFLILLAGVYLMQFAATLLKESTFRENGVIENTQLVLLFGTALIFLFQAIRYPKHIAFLCCLAALCAFAGIRELNNLLDTLIPFVSWKFAFILPLSAFGFALSRRKEWMRSLFQFLNLPAFYMMMGAMILFIPVAQCIGHNAFIRDALGQNNVSEIKELFEEATETIAYLWILLAAVETWWNLKRASGKKR